MCSTYPAVLDTRVLVHDYGMFCRSGKQGGQPGVLLYLDSTKRHSILNGSTCYMYIYIASVALPCCSSGSTPCRREARTHI
jgi:hypothetical protein